MASLLSQASTYEENDTNIINENRQNRKNSKTIKKRPTYGVEPGKKKCIETLMQMTSNDDDDDETGLVDFQPPSKPELTRMPTTHQPDTHNETNIKKLFNNDGSLKTSVTSGQSNNTINQHLSQPSLYSNAYSVPSNLEANFNNAISNVQANMTNNSSGNNNTIVSNLNHQPANIQGNINEQLNYIIHLLEEQQNTKTSTTTEELILYTFLGVFTIYIVDSFTKISKSYTR